MHASPFSSLLLVYLHIRTFIHAVTTKSTPSKHAHKTNQLNFITKTKRSKTNRFDIWTPQFLLSSSLLLSQLLLVWYIMKSSEIFIHCSSLNFSFLQDAMHYTTNNKLFTNYEIKSTLTLLLHHVNLTHHCNVDSILTSFFGTSPHSNISNISNKFSVPMLWIKKHDSEHSCG